MENPWILPFMSTVGALSLSYILQSGYLTCALMACGLLFCPIFVLLSYFIYCSWSHDSGNCNWEKWITVKPFAQAMQMDSSLQALISNFVSLPVSFKLCNWEKWITVKGVSFPPNQKIPVETFIEAYMNGQVDLKTDFYELFLHRNELFRFCFTWNIIKFYVFTFLGQNLDHSKKADNGDIAHVYNRGNDFYNWFLGPTMVYTSGLYLHENDSLEDAQKRKLDMVCKQTQMKPGNKHLDLGCGTCTFSHIYFLLSYFTNNKILLFLGWGTLAVYAAKHYGTHSTGITLAQEQVDFGKKQAEEHKVSDQVDLKVCDYRDLKSGHNDPKYDIITCLEMAEHVSLFEFYLFLSIHNSCNTPFFCI